MNRHTEQEWQFAAAELGAARAWMAAQPREHSERRFARRPTLQLQDTYYDSPDWMIFRAGYALRVRREREDDVAGEAQTEITLKSLHTPQGALARRTEYSERVTTTDIGTLLARPDGIGERIRELVGLRPLTPLFHARTRRERQHLLEADTELPLAEVDLDETSIEAPSGAARELMRVEVECINAEPAALTAWVEQLRDAARLQPVDGSKFRAGLATAGLDPTAPLELGSLEISAAQPFAITQLAMLRRYFAAVLVKEPLVRAGSAAALHEMRIAARHLDALLKIFRGFGPPWATGSRGALRILIKSLGEVRDCDVQLQYLQASLEGTNASEREALAPLRERLELTRRGNRTRLLNTLDSERFRDWIDRWLAQLREGAPGGPRAQHTATAIAARDLIRQQSRRLRKRADKLDENSAAEDYHQVRIRAKRLRYALDAFESLYGDTAHTCTRALAKLQNVLGEYHDAAVRAQNFAQLVSSTPRLPSATTFMIGRLVERDLRAFEKCRRKFPKAYRRVQGRRWRALRDEMETQARKVAALNVTASTTQA